MISSRLICALTLSLSGCAQGIPESALADLRNRLTESQRKEADGRRRVEELENRVFLLTDQLESHKVASQSVRAPRLPVVTLRPTEDDPSRAIAVRGDSEPESREEIEFTGAARSADPSRVRPMLRGDGPYGAPAISEARPPRARAQSSHAPSEVRLVSQGSGDSLGVAPVPPIPKPGLASATKAPPSIAPPIVALDRNAVDQEPLAQYRAAYGELAAGRYEPAEQKLRAFVTRYPRHDYADNAQYWLGETFYARQQYREAAVEFRATVAKYPVGNKAPDALLKLAYSLLSLNEGAEARRLLGELPSTYPRSEASRLATQKLAELSPSHQPVSETLEAPR